MNKKLNTVTKTYNYNIDTLIQIVLKKNKICVNNNSNSKQQKLKALCVAVCKSECGFEQLYTSKSTVRV